MFILLGKIRKDFKTILSGIPAEKKQAVLKQVEKLLLEALKVYIQSQVKK